MQFTSRFTALLSLILLGATSIAQPDSFQLLDGIIGVVGDEIILHSELEERIFQEKMQGKFIT